MAVVKILCWLLLTYHLSEGKRIKENKTAGAHRVGLLRLTELQGGKSAFGLYSEGDACTLDALRPHTLASCGFNSSHPLIIITHGWSLTGVMENWVFRLASALKTSLSDVNVVITDWLSLAEQNYPTAVQNTRLVGWDIARFLQALQEQHNFPPKMVHLIGYSLGAHISGFAGSYLGGSEKIGRITGLDPAGPLFEGMSPTDRLSPDDAHFVDAIHTFTHECLGVSVGIKQPVGHLDFYPNGGSLQPGCDLQNVLEHMTEYGLTGFQQTVKCAHERSVHLFIDSVVNRDKPSVAYVCGDQGAFDSGRCLDCRRNRCSTMGYGAALARPGSGRKLFLRTRPRTPYKVFHYQFRIQFVDQIKGIKPTLTVSLTGTKEESCDFPIIFTENISGNKTYSFLTTLDRDIGELMMLRLRWDGSALWNMWDRVQDIMPWGFLTSKPQLTVGKITVKAGETQQRTTFCAMTNGPRVQVSQDKVFVRCKQKPRRGH